MDRAEHRGPDLEDGGHLLGPDPEMSHVQEELVTQIPTYGEVLGGPHYLHAFSLDLVPSGRPLILHGHALDDDGGLDAGLLHSLEGVVSELVPVKGDLYDAR